jgi:hypothetical protein
MKYPLVIYQFVAGTADVIHDFIFSALIKSPADSSAYIVQNLVL